MTAKKGGTERWRQTTALFRDDLLAQAQASGLDIGDICNRALAAATGIGYESIRGAASPGPVIIAGNGTPTEVPGGEMPALREAVTPDPVINADDPRSPSVVKQAPKKSGRKAPPSLPGRVSVPEKPAEETPPASPEPPSLKDEKTPRHAPAPSKKTKGSAIKKFVAERVARELTVECYISKETLYEAFARWCREHRVTPVPDHKSVTVSLKTQFAMKEKTIGGEPSWLNIRLKM